MPSVRLKEHEPFDIAIRRFKRACEKAGILSETRRREFYEKPAQVRKRKSAAAVKRLLKKLSREQGPLPGQLADRGKMKRGKASKGGRGRR